MIIASDHDDAVIGDTGIAFEERSSVAIIDTLWVHRSAQGRASVR